MRADCIIITTLLSVFPVLQHVVTGQGHHECPLGCRCDFESQYKRVRCEVTDSGIVINFHDIDSDIHFLEILPRQRGRIDTFGPSLPDVFLDFPFLERLIIRNNGITNIPSNTARQLSKLRALDVSQNEISSLRGLSLDILSGLESLELSSNFLRSIESGEFQRLVRLRFLGLSSNKIQSLSPTAFDNLHNLETLDLAGNLLRDLPVGILSRSGRLQYLDLSGNQFSSVPQETLSIRGLTNLLLDDNQITTVSSSVVTFWRSPSLQAVTLSNNPILCDRSVTDFVSWVQTAEGARKVCNADQRDGRRRPCPSCSQPRVLAGLPVNELNLRDLGQSDQPGGTGSSHPNSGGGFVTFQVGDPSERLTAGSNSTRDTGVQRQIYDLTDRVRRSLPDAGVECSATKCYIFSAGGTRSWSTAQSTCRDLGLDLAEIGNPAEQKELMSLLIKSVQENAHRSSPSRGWWIGLRYSPRRRETSYATTGRIASYTNWAAGRPNLIGFSDECVELLDIGQWNDGPCTLHIDNQFVCQTMLSSNQQTDTRSARSPFTPQRQSADSAFFTIVE
ncbi:uncharacterized protein LOC129585718 [Paramacrobiotus metropolitanus]|uniref:uncharacterized protein LOC129585718 n=1 Tax=Paramacrobiotus metropolitanus TaxID=2943436 RepID=UPI002445A779|nr:uncharacterized protein LOC129585718 [Paramacrobiotus metropolitanus]